MRNFLIALLFLGCMFFGVKGQDSNNELLKKLVEKNVLTQSEADELTKEQASQKQTLVEKVKKVREAFDAPYFRLGGYSLFWYRYKQYDKVHHDMSPRVIFLSMNGHLNEHFRYFILAEFVDPMVYDFYGEWMPHKSFNLRGGQFKVPFTFENMISLTDMETALNTRSVSNLAGMGGDPLQFSNAKWKNKTGRDIGIQASGMIFDMSDHHLVHYAAGVFQGTGINVSENNSTKDFAGTLTLQPTKEFRLAGGVYAGKAAIFDKSGDFQRDQVRNRWAISTDYTSDRIYARAEWIEANDGGVKKEGIHGTGLYYILPKKVNLVGKIDYYNQNKARNSEVIDYIAAVNYHFSGKSRLQLNYKFSDYSKNWADNGHATENSLELQMQIVF